jgi:peptidoglycan/xylan/chitin deacetylase (PgdA/CDA1 family)
VKQGIFIISLDFELHWGGFEKWELGRRETADGKRRWGSYFLNTREVIPRMLRLFEQHGVHVTWAGVGLLFHENRQQMEASMPQVKPTYVHRELSAYEYIRTRGIGDHEEDDPFHYAHRLIVQILNTPHQELGSHTFAHFYCNEEGQTPGQFRADLQAAQQAASRYGVRMKSLVFPRNQFNDDYLKVCFEEGFVCVRSNPVDWFWRIDTREESRWKRLNRGVDAYFPLGNKNSYALSSLVVRKGFPVCLPASRLLRPYRPKEMFLNTFKIRRIMNEMELAARAGEVYHLWWHPHNFGNFPDENLEGLSFILQHFEKMRNSFGMESLGMGELGERLAEMGEYENVRM